VISHSFKLSNNKRCSSSDDDNVPTSPNTAGPWNFCSKPDGTCDFSGTRTIRYGMFGKWTHKLAKSGFKCTTEFFGTDPNPGQVKDCWVDGAPIASNLEQEANSGTDADGPWSYCATEDSNCNFSGKKTVRFGAYGLYNYKVLSDGTSCSTGTLGTPPKMGYGGTGDCHINGSLETDSSAPQGPWTYCAYQNQGCSFSGTRTVRYGIHGKYKYKDATGSISCTDVSFGDPTPGIPKDCWYNGDKGMNKKGPWQYCAMQNSVCGGFSGAKTVIYGARGKFFYKVLSAGFVCTDSVLGDPTPGTVKDCWYEAN